MGDNGLRWTNDTRRLGDLIPWRSNPRQIKEHEAGRLLDSLVRFGQVQTIAIGPDNDIYDGHQRKYVWAAAARFGPDFEVDVRVSSRPLTERERQQLAVYLHEGATGEWNFDELANWDVEVDDLVEWGFTEDKLGLAGWNFDDESGDAPEPQIDRAAGLQEKWQVQRGQVWEIPSLRLPGKCHRVMCGDSTDAGDVERLMGESRPFLMVTDPPYGVEYDPLFRERVLGAADRRAGTVINDDTQSWQIAFEHFGGGVAYVWHADKQAIQSGLDLMACKFEIRATIIWKKPHSPFGQGHYNYQHEPCWYAVRRGVSSRWRGNRKDSTVWEIPLDKTVIGGHGTQKPLECMARPIRNHEGNAYDPFLGSGTTIVACEQTARIGYGMEIEPKYCAVTLERLSGMGLEPRLVE